MNTSIIIPAGFHRKQGSSDQDGPTREIFTLAGGLLIQYCQGNFVGFDLIENGENIPLHRLVLCGVAVIIA
jgi:hypothetical protein